MCHPLDKAEKRRRGLGNKLVEHAFPSDLIKALPPNIAEYGRCFVCGVALDKSHMFPKKRAPRYLCERCFEIGAYQSPKELCLPWGMSLPVSMVNERFQNPREFTNAICAGPCRDYWRILAGQVLGFKFKTRYTLPPALGNPIKLPCTNEPIYANPLPHLYSRLPHNGKGVIAEYEYGRKKMVYMGFF